MVNWMHMYQISWVRCLYRFNCLYIKSIGSDIESIVLMFKQMTMMRCDKVMISIQLSMYQINWIDIELNSNKTTLNRLTMMLCDDSEPIESNRIASHRFEQDDVEPIDHEALRSAIVGFILVLSLVLKNNLAGNEMNAKVWPRNVFN